jgi:hypothetical protein
MSNYTKLSHDDLVSYANSIIHSRQKSVHSGGGSHVVSSSNTLGDIGEGGNYWDISLEQGWSEGDIANLAMNTLGMGDDSIIDEILWSKLGIMGQLLKNLNFDPNRCANCLRLINHRANECNENCRFCKQKAEHPSLMCELAPQDNLSWGQVLKAMDEKYPNANGKYMTKDTRTHGKGVTGVGHIGNQGRGGRGDWRQGRGGRGRGRGGPQNQTQKGEQRQYFTKEEEAGFNKEDLARICSQD